MRASVHLALILSFILQGLGRIFTRPLSLPPGSLVSSLPGRSVLDRARRPGHTMRAGAWPARPRSSMGGHLQRHGYITVPINPSP